MSATSLRFNNRTTRVPNAYTRVDASGLEGPSPGSTGRVLIIGEADGGAPYTAVTPETVVRARTSETLRRAFRAGDLKEAGAMLAKPANQSDVAGAEEVIALKVRPDTASAVTMTNGSGNAMVVRSRDYGPHTNQIAVSIAAGTTAGRRVTVAFEGVSESRDNIGGVALVTLQYREPPAVGWDAMTFAVVPAGVRASGTRAESGRSGDLLNTPLAEAVRVVSSSAGDVGQIATIYALVGGVPTAIQLTINGITQVVSTAVVDAGQVFGVVLSAACVGTITVSQATGPISLFTIAPAALAAGGVIGRGMFVQGALTLVADAATTAVVLIAGRNASGAVVLEQRALTGTTPVATVTSTWRQTDFIGLALVPAARTITFTATAAETQHAVQDTLIKLRDFLNALQVVVSGTTYGFSAVINTTRSTYDPGDLDLTSAASGYFPASVGLLADLAMIVEYLNNDSAYVTAEESPGAVGAPSNTTTPVYLAGAVQGTTLFADWQGALDFARDIECDTIVVLTADPAVHAALGEHLDYRAGPGRSEADGVVGVMNAGLTGLASRTELRAQIAALNNRNIRVMAQQVDRYNTEGFRTPFPPYMAACLLAGSQAGMALTRSLTHVTLNILSEGHHTSWDPKDDIEELLEAGLVVIEREGGTFRVVRDVTSAVGSDNPAFTDGSANRIVNYCTRDLRSVLDPYVGRGESPTVLKGVARARLNSYVNEVKCLTAWRDLVVSKSLDQAPVAVSMAPNFVTNFIPVSIYLYDEPVTG